MILIDYNQAMITSLTGKWARSIESTEENLRAIFLERIRTIQRKYSGEFGKTVICCDGPNYWRKRMFPFYKAGRKAIRDNSSMDWPMIHTMLTKFRSELIEHFPYKVIHLEGAEADDIIGVLAKAISPHEPVLILSGDGDFKQLQKFPNVKQYSPITQKFLVSENPDMELKEKIMRGDRGDGIPNFLSPDNTFLTEDTKQTTLTTKKVSLWLQQNPEVFCDTAEATRGWDRNKTLIDLDCIPDEIINRIMTEYENQDDRPVFRRDGLISYFIANGMIRFMENLQDF